MSYKFLRISIGSISICIPALMIYLCASNDVDNSDILSKDGCIPTHEEQILCQRRYKYKRIANTYTQEDSKNNCRTKNTISICYTRNTTLVHTDGRHLVNNDLNSDSVQLLMDREVPSRC